MNAIATLSRNTLCAAVAAMICVLSSMAFVESTTVGTGRRGDHDADRVAAAADRLVRPAAAGRFGRLVR